MRFLGLMVMVLGLPGHVSAAPEPPPPGDYPGAQYIDRSGCVFVREGGGWVPRRDKDDAPVCGFPPSKPALEQVAAPPPSPEAVLTEILAQGLRSGDLVSEPAPEPLAQPSPDPAQAELNASLARQIALDDKLRSAMTGTAPQGLCARLGYRTGGDATPIVGGDVTQGLCPGMTADSPAPLAVATAPKPHTASAAAPERQPVRADPRPAASKPAEPKPVGSAGQQAHVAEKPSSVVVRRIAPVQPTKTAPVEMIPAHARYVQIGTYGDQANALAALRRLSQMGYRTAQRHEQRDDGPHKVILAGPFTDRQALVTALTRLRAQGYPRAVAR